LGAEGGFLMVKTWWMRGETWRVDTMFLASEKHANFSNLFLEGES
jgi:hypothetical protein